MKNKLLTALLGVAVAVLILTFSIGLPIYVRPFYYMHVDMLDLPGRTGFDREVIIEAYDEMLDFCTIPWAEFGTGELKYSESGESHFADCKGLFLLNGFALVISLVLTVVLLVLRKKGVFELVRPFGFDVSFFSAVGLNTVFILIAALASIDFDKAFTIFHTIFFPGKDNWLFNPYTDQIILVLPQNFFMDCAILIASSIIIISLVLIITGIVRRKKRA
ncbi:MAG: TIGR01906 family membrane protein [Clostridia bacterium]|nr:TIGR01906 family membrane protein [Clostridia bacterium]